MKRAYLRLRPEKRRKNSGSKGLIYPMMLDFPLKKLIHDLNRLTYSSQKKYIRAFRST